MQKAYHRKDTKAIGAAEQRGIVFFFPGEYE
jgi:hypothetical protein